MSKFREVGIEPASRHGQNFLIDLNLVQVIVEAAELTDQDVVLEVGTGTGSLTQLMAQRTAAVVTVEIDSHLFELASEHLIDFPHVTMLKLDALKNKNQFDQHIMEVVGEKLEEHPGTKLKLVSNLPYNIATPVLSNLLLTDHVPDMMVATIQKEVADRIVAQPWSKDYGALSVWMQAQTDAEILRLMPPSVFWPAPKVESAIIRIMVDRERQRAIPDLKYFHQFVKAIFIHRRKFLRANVVSAMKRHLTKSEVDEVLAEMDLAPETRTEQLDVVALLRMTELFRQRVPDWSL